MAIMKTCCCCGVRSGSTTCGIYSMIIAVLGVIVFVIDLINLPLTKEVLHEIGETSEFSDLLGDLDIDSYVCAQKVSYIFGVIFLVAVFFTSIVLIVGINKDSKEMLVPFMIAKGVGLLWYIYAFSVALYAIVQMGMQFAGIGVLAFVIVIGPFFAADVVCIICVLSQYQEYRDGRGRISDTTRQTTVIIQQHQPSGGVAYQPMQESPPPSYYPSSPEQKVVPGAV